MRSSTILAGVVAALVVAVGAVAATQPPPKKLFQALLTGTLPERKIPSGFYNPKVGIDKPSEAAKKHHVVGEVKINFGSEAELDYVIFPTRADAVADWKDADIRKRAKTTLDAPPDFPWPAIIANYSITGKNIFGKKVTNGVTVAAFTSKNVIVDAITISTDSTESGDIPGAIKLARFGLSYLNSVRARIG